MKTYTNGLIEQNILCQYDVLNGMKTTKEVNKRNIKAVKAVKDSLQEKAIETVCNAISNNFNNIVFKSYFEQYGLYAIVQTIASDTIENGYDIILENLQEQKATEKEIELIHNVYVKYTSVLTKLIKSNQKIVADKLAVLLDNKDNKLENLDILLSNTLVNKKLRVNNLLTNGLLLFNQKDTKNLVVKAEKYIKENAKQIVTESELMDTDYGILTSYLKPKDLKTYTKSKDTLGKAWLVSTIERYNKFTVISDDERKALNKYNIVF